MLNSNYRTSYFNKPNDTMTTILSSLYYNTVTCELQWGKAYDYNLCEYYYYAEDKNFREKYYFFVNSPIVGTVLQMVSDKMEMNYEIDDRIFAKELGKLAGAIMNADKMKLPAKKNDYYGTNYGSNYSTYNYKSYKQIKREKADKQLSQIEPLHNQEML